MAKVNFTCTARVTGVSKGSFGDFIDERALPSWISCLKMCGVLAQFPDTQHTPLHSAADACIHAWDFTNIVRCGIVVRIECKKA